MKGVTEISFLGSQFLYQFSYTAFSVLHKYITLDPGQLSLFTQASRISLEFLYGERERISHNTFLPRIKMPQWKPICNQHWRRQHVHFPIWRSLAKNIISQHVATAAQRIHFSHRSEEHSSVQDCPENYFYYLIQTWDSRIKAIQSIQNYTNLQVQQSIKTKLLVKKFSQVNSFSFIISVSGVVGLKVQVRLLLTLLFESEHPWFLFSE